MYCVPSIHYLCGSDPGSAALSCCRAEATLMSFISYCLPSFSLKPGSEEAGSSAVSSFTSWGWKLFKAPNRSEELLIPSWSFRMKIFLFYLVFEGPFNFLGQSGFRWSSQSDKWSHGWTLWAHKCSLSAHQDKGVSSDDGLAKGTLEDSSRTTIFRWWEIVCFLSHQKPSTWSVTYSSQGAREANRFLKRLQKYNLLRYKKKEINSNFGVLKVKLHLEDDFAPSWIERLTK